MENLVAEPCTPKRPGYAWPSTRVEGRCWCTKVSGRVLVHQVKRRRCWCTRVEEGKVLVHQDRGRRTVLVHQVRKERRVLVHQVKEGRRPSPGNLVSGPGTPKRLRFSEAEHRGRLRP